MLHATCVIMNISTTTSSIFLSKIIILFWDFHVENKIFMNIFLIFIFLHKILFFEKENFNTFENNIISVKGTKV
jgi:hypothetical protein